MLIFVTLMCVVRNTAYDGRRGEIVDGRGGHAQLDSTLKTQHQGKQARKIKETTQLPIQNKTNLSLSNRAEELVSEEIATTTRLAATLNKFANKAEELVLMSEAIATTTTRSAAAFPEPMLAPAPTDDSNYSLQTGLCKYAGAAHLFALTSWHGVPREPPPNHCFIGVGAVLRDHLRAFQNL